ncbi:hypothetical protein MCOR25_003003 [Pyricularia grisea]|nr:hypothetical protein MCOR25_003003 [Pyricularia grisea]
MEPTAFRSAATDVQSLTKIFLGLPRAGHRRDGDDDVGSVLLRYPDGRRASPPSEQRHQLWDAKPPSNTIYVIWIKEDKRRESEWYQGAVRSRGRSRQGGMEKLIRSANGFHCEPSSPGCSVQIVNLDYNVAVAELKCLDENLRAVIVVAAGRQDVDYPKDTIEHYPGNFKIYSDLDNMIVDLARLLTRDGETLGNATVLCMQRAPTTTTTTTRPPLFSDAPTPTPTPTPTFTTDCVLTTTSVCFDGGGIRSD